MGLHALLRVVRQLNQAIATGFERDGQIQLSVSVIQQVS